MKRFYEAHGAMEHTVLFSTDFFNRIPKETDFISF
jgi:hypothetical protein